MDEASPLDNARIFLHNPPRHPRLPTEMMKQFHLPLLLAAVLSLPLGAAPEPIDDVQVIKSLSNELGTLVEEGKAASAEKLAPQLKRSTCKLKLLPASKNKPYEASYDSVVAIAAVYKCGKCDKWHNTGAATAWVLSEDGVMVTNYHVFAGKPVSGFGIRTLDGRVAPVTEILAASQWNDIVIFKVAGTGYKPLALGTDPRVGTDVHIIAHPDSRFFTYTYGKVSRYYRDRALSKQSAPVMAVTAEFARGSSGGPVMDSMGNVIGMVSNTQSIYCPPIKKEDRHGPFQMAIRNCIPVSAIRALIEKP